jgi:hypothetical protein
MTIVSANDASFVDFFHNNEVPRKINSNDEK